MENNFKEKLFYNIGEVAKAFNVNPSLIRYWEKEFEILNPKKTLRGTRKYNSVDIKNLKLIYNLLKNRGFTIEGAKEKIKSESKKFEIVEKLERIKAQLILIEKEI
jgi:DNA-binding transcriptional MerR regulator